MVYIHVTKLADTGTEEDDPMAVQREDTASGHLTEKSLKKLVICRSARDGCNGGLGEYRIKQQQLTHSAATYS